HKGDTLVKVDRRDPTTSYNQAQADLEVAQAQAANAAAQKRRADEMFAAGVLSEQDHDNANLADANARAQLVRAQAGLQSAQDALTDCNVLAPVDGTILTKKVEAGAVITSAVRDVSGGTVLLQMADLSTVEVSALVDETDIGKVQPGMVTTITVDAYPNRPFQGTVLKIEPQSTVSQNVTMFAVLIQIPNPGGLLRPGMNAEVAIQIGQRQGVLAIPTSALRTPRDVSSAAQVLGLDPKEVDRQLAVQDSIARANPQLASAGASGRGAQADPSPGGRAVEGGNVPSLQAAEPPRAAGATGNPAASGTPQRPTGEARIAGGPGGAPGGFQLPPGVTPEQMGELRRKRMANEPLTAQDSAVMQKIRQWREQQGGAGPGVGAGTQPAAGAAAQGAEQNGAGADMQQLRAIFQKQRSGQQLTPQEQAIMQQAMRRFQQSGGMNGQGRRRFGEGNNYQFGGSFIVFILKNGKPAPTRVRTGLTDMDFSEVLTGIGEQDTVLLLPSASLVQSQAEMRDRMQRFAGSPVPGMQQGARTAAPVAGPGPRAGGR
ncbi:MAG TPA: efflux RND transporter periplasmic adaptor subunit, partial [Streptosporangiaceae bacterium]|nr:efflux RND transporter periplasmic adaptor subunit [Streptosporangiaceae bacterium]